MSGGRSNGWPGDEEGWKRRVYLSDDMTSEVWEDINAFEIC